MSSARDAILGAVRASLDADPRARATLRTVEPAADHEALGAPSDLGSAEQRSLRFKGLLEAVDGECHVVRDEAAAAEVLRALLAERGVRRVAVSDSAPARALVAAAGEGLDLEVLEDPADRPALLECEVGVSGAQWGIAETGTLVLLSDDERHRLVSLVPPVHVAVLDAARILGTLEEALERIRGEDPQDLCRAVTLVTGPSRTGDIELTLVVGVHGPRELVVLLVDGGAGTGA